MNAYQTGKDEALARLRMIRNLDGPDRQAAQDQLAGFLSVVTAADAPCRTCRARDAVALDVAEDIVWPDDGDQLERAWRELPTGARQVFANFDAFASQVEAAAERNAR